ncbi:deoxyribose-phosphate aldolase [Halanaerobium hydrogeniformans]|uniref:Deoxyribose-phosphate aldolase n=1 Tax=Halanaerobium hydrogeniformans TaxID=656519 RepID=E4RNP7_HALHG|nr:deoxyribose-phosphate aldolase [Halanaerobium hydrogeniformans]ADQ13725.1 deoxyribose-phosphate aldolase [Halanaerobium hydrogeniformans]
MKITVDNIAQMIDQSKLDPYVTEKEIIEFCKEVNEYDFIAAFVLPANLPIAKKELKNSSVKLGTGIGFPFGTTTTKSKLQECEEALGLGVDELDTVINIGALKSGKYEYVYNELKQMVELIAPKPLKVILEVSYLTPEEIKEGTRIGCKAGVEYVKTGTGYGGRDTNLFDINLIAEAIDEDTKIKAAGGIRDIYTLIEMYKLGVRRFGVSRGPKIVEQFKKYFPDGIEI